MPKYGVSFHLLLLESTRIPLRLNTANLALKPETVKGILAA